MIIFSFVLAISALIALVGSFISSPDCSAALTNIATVISIVLGVLSIVYSSVSNRSTDKLLKDIRAEFENVSKEAQTRFVERNVGKENSDNVKKMLQKRLKDESKK